MASGSTNDAPHIGPPPVAANNQRHGHGGGGSSYQSALIGVSNALSSLTPSAIVPLQRNPVPMQFSTIRLNTDLNHLPHDWAKTKFQGYAGFNNTSVNAFSAFTSVNLAHNHMNLVGRVDVISSSKNIKDLLKMPYQKSPHISLMVHRLGKTLLLEEFDVHKNLIKKESEQWRWLNDFFQRYVNKKDTSSLIPLNSPKKELLSDLMYRNLIRHSITASVANNACTILENSKEAPINMHQTEEEKQDLKGFHHESIWKFYDGSMLVDSELPIFGTDSKSPCISLRLRDSPPVSVLTGLDYWLDNLMSNVPEVAMVYHINGFVQKYEILRTEDIPNMENSRFEPDEVMELARNVFSFIRNKAVVEGNTYWLYKSPDDDTVKLYNLTEYCRKDLRKDDNPFTVPVGLLCYNVGRNVKGRGEKKIATCRSMLQKCLHLLDAERHPEVCANAHFMLADLWVPDQSLRDIWDPQGKANDQPEESDDDNYLERNPRPNVQGATATEPDNGSQKEKLTNVEVDGAKNTVSLKDMSLKESYPDPIKPPQKYPKKWDEEDENAVMMKELMVRGVIKQRSFDIIQTYRIVGETDERCRTALDHIRKGLELIDRDLARKSKMPFNGRDRASSPSATVSSPQCAADVERDQLRFAKPFVPIPLHYSPIHPKNNNEQSSKTSPKPDNITQETETESTSNTESDSDEWHPALKHKLLHKAALVFSVMSNSFHGCSMRGHTLRYVRYGLHCFECLFKQNPKRQPDALEEEIYLHLIHLAARARSCMDGSGIIANKKEFEELGEVEAAILHSAQGILQMPKEAWIYKWPVNEEKNLRAARELFLRLLRVKFLEKKSSELRTTIRNQYGVCVLNLGHVYRKQMLERVAAGDTFEEIEPLMTKSKGNYEDAVSSFISLNDKNTAGLWQTYIAKLYDGASEALKNHNKDENNPVSKEEYAMVEKIMATYEKALSIYERDASADLSREDIFHAMRDKWYYLATRYFSLDTLEAPAESSKNEKGGKKQNSKDINSGKKRNSKDDEDDKKKKAKFYASYQKAKEHLFKSLNYCFLDLDISSPHAFKSYRIGAIDHFNLAVLCQRERNLHEFNSTQYKCLRRKMNEHAAKAYELYFHMKWSRSQIAVKLFYIKDVLMEFKKYPPKHHRKTLRAIMLQVTSLKYAVNCMHMARVDKRDDSKQVPNFFDGLQMILKTMNEVFQLWLKNETHTPLYRQLKGMYRKAIDYSTYSEWEFIAFKLCDFFTQVETLMNEDAHPNNFT